MPKPAEDSYFIRKGIGSNPGRNKCPYRDFNSFSLYFQENESVNVSTYSLSQLRFANNPATRQSIS